MQPLFHDVIKNMKQLGVILYLLCLTTCYELWATPHNVAYQAKVSCSSALSQEQEGKYVIDQVIRISGKGEWVAKTKLDVAWSGVSVSLDTIRLGSCEFIRIRLFYTIGWMSEAIVLRVPCSLVTVVR